MIKETITKIANRLTSLEDIQGVTVTTSDEKKTIYVAYKTHRSLDFKLVWSNDHYIGYFMDGEGNQSQAVLAIWEPIEAIPLPPLIPCCLSFGRVGSERVNDGTDTDWRSVCVALAAS